MDGLEPIAIVGIGCRFPGAHGPEAFWRLLSDGVDAITEVPPERWAIDDYYDADSAAPGKMNTRWGGFVSGIDQFDPHFFRISPRESARMDPQHRLLLETSWEALEDAGQDVDRLAGSRTGVFVGISCDDYARMQLGDAGGIDVHSNTGVSYSIAANRISYTFDFRGPSLVLDTACSTSLNAVHLACQSLRSGESDLALAGGANALLSPEVTIGFSKLNAMAPDGRCKAFDAAANGYVRGEGSGVLVLKRYSDALADGDLIYALIRGSAINQDGRSNGLTAPNRLAQQAVLEDAYRNAGLSPAEVDVIEAHGTGTLLGDPIEAQALGTVLGPGRERPCWLGSVKTNIGHLEAAAGAAGLIKAALALHHRAVPPSLHFVTPNAYIPFERLGLRVPTRLEPLPTNRPAVAGVSGFSFGGANAHVVLQAVDEAPREAHAEQNVRLLPLSARSPEALRSLARAYHRRLTDDPSLDLADLCHTAARRRTPMASRLALVFQDRAELLELLEGFASGESAANAIQGDSPARPPKVAFVFPGQGSQWIGMGRELLEQEPVFRETLEAIERALSAHVSWSLLDILQGRAPESLLEEIDVIQPVLFAMQVGLSALWRSWGVPPRAVVGHSMGEVAAAHVAGRLSLDDAARIIARRCQLMKPLSGQGAMLAVELSPEHLEGMLTRFEGQVAIGVHNSPDSTVLSGDPAALQDIQRRLEAQEVFCRPVKVSVASHSPQMDVVEGPLLETLAGLTPAESALSFYSTVDGEPLKRPLDAGYWWQNLRQPVRFSEAIQRMLQDGVTTFIEISPHPILLPAIQQGAAHLEKQALVLPSLRRAEPERERLLSSLGGLYVHGLAPDWRQVAGGGRAVRLPAYPWEHERCWIEQSGLPSVRRTSASMGLHPLLGESVELAHMPDQRIWETPFDLERFPFLADHRILNRVVVPGAAFVALMWAATQAAGRGAIALAEIAFHEPLVIGPGESLRVQVSLSRDGSLQIHGRNDDAWRLHATGRLLETAPEPMAPPGEPLAAGTPAEPFYERLCARGLELGPTFRGLRQLSVSSDSLQAEVQAPAEIASDVQRFGLHPALLDAAGQAMLDAIGETAGDLPFVPVGIRHAQLYAPLTAGMRCHAQVTLRSDSAFEGDFVLVDDAQHVLLSVQGIRFQALTLAQAWKAPEKQGIETLYEILWHSQPRPSGDRAGDPGAWLVCSDGPGLGDRLVEALARQGDRVVAVERGTTFERLGADRFRLDPDQPEQVSRLLAEALNEDQPCKGIVHLWGLAEPDVSSDRASEVSDRCLGLLSLVQAIAKAGWRDVPRLWVVTCGAQGVLPQEPVAIVQAPLWGLGRVVRLEHPELRCSNLDLDPALADPLPELAAELLCDDEEDQVSLRGTERFVARLARRTLEPGDRAEVHADATYLVTGGHGGLGMALAGWLIERGARNLVLVSRRSPEPEVLERLDAWRQSGVRIMSGLCDVSDRSGLERVLLEARESMPALRGVIHAAGILDDQTLLHLERDRLQRVLAPKVDGAWNLHELTLGSQLDCFVLYSSAASMLGSPGQGNYAAANAYMDALAAWRKEHGLCALSISWGPWSDIGLAARPDRGGRLSTGGVSSLSPAQALETLGELLNQPLAHVGVVPLRVRQWFQMYPKLSDAPFMRLLAREASPRGGGAVRAALESTEPGPLRRLALENHLRAEVAQVARLDAGRVDAHTPLKSLGFDSLMALELRNRLEISLGLSLSATMVWSYPTIEALMGHLAQRMGLSLEATVSATRVPEAAEPLEMSIRRLSEAEVEARLLERLAAIEAEG